MAGRLMALQVEVHGADSLQCQTSQRLSSGGYAVSRADVALFHEQGFVHLPGVLSQEELQQVIEPVYTMFMRNEIPIPGKDLCDMSGAKGRTPDQYTVYNVMLPRKYYPEWQGNLFERRCQQIADQLQGGDMAVDYDQILAKRPHSEDAIFAWHQDMAYWPPHTKETATATCWLAVSAATLENGCMRYVPGSHKEKELRKHEPVGKTREESHALKTILRGGDAVKAWPCKAGDVIVHNERVIHSSGPNLSDGWRRAYVLAFRKRSTVAEERDMGFSHSHNDTVNWDKFHKHGVA
ncbi:hypothetical protein WJX72_006502 [[Myrmecia] bisecta]|uniref:Phytanoyl-CoA dioxygenase n=1 Tax=[Myrmecia] bisecta TaxID=41462 RepID=A0AAW1Q7L4_9CHLO